MLDNALTVVITGLVYAGVAVLLVTILVANVYAIVHAWRSDRLEWAIVLSALFLTGGGGIATAVYLVFHHSEPMPRSTRRRPVPGIS